MGEVWRVRDRELNRTLAMKVVKPALLRQPASLARFVEEAQATAQLQHPGIVSVYDVGRLEDGRRYFTMKEIRGRTFGKVIAEVHEAGRRGPSCDVDSDPMVTNVALRFEKELKLPVRPRSVKANELILKSLPDLRRQLMNDQSRRRLSGNDDRSVKQ